MEQHPPAALTLPFVEARHYLRGAPRRRVDLIVLHCMEAPEKSNRAEACARYFASLPDAGPKASAHFTVDNDSIVQCVRDEFVAYHAPGANHNGIGIEHAGYAKQSREEWLDDFGLAMLQRSAGLAARLCRRWNIPVTLVLPTGLRIGQRGITTHAYVSEAFGRSKHWDPGPSFPLDRYLNWVAGST
jgi:N-acetyl-anhydromuramyl-L-alanine amidase AmpD